MKKKKKKKINIKKIIKLIISIIMLILSLVCFKYVCDLDILPNKYLFLFLAVILILNIISTIFIFMKGKIIYGAAVCFVGACRQQHRRVGQGCRTFQPQRI